MIGIILVGLIATQLGTYFGYVFPAVGLPTLPWPLYNGVLGAPATDYGTAGSFFVGQTLHFVNGIVFAILYAVLALPFMPFRNTKGGNILSGRLRRGAPEAVSRWFIHVTRGFSSVKPGRAWAVPPGVRAQKGMVRPPFARNVFPVEYRPASDAR